MKKSIVLDKSYFEGKSLQQIQEFVEGYNVLMCEALFFELLTSSRPWSCSACFRKLPNGNNPIELIEHTGIHIDYEIKNQKPAFPIINFRIDKQFRFDERLGAGSFPLSNEMRSTINAWEIKISREADYRKLLGITIHDHFPSVAICTKSQLDDEIKCLRNSIANDTKFVLKIYSKLRDPTFPTADIITPNWAIFRKLQIDMLAALEYIRRYGVANPNVVAKELIQDAADQQILLLSCLADGLASCDKRLQDNYKLLRPEGLLLNGCK